MTTFRHRTPEKFSRISDLEWEKWKPVILEKYQSSTLEEVTDHMERAYGFIATCVISNVLNCVALTLTRNGNQTQTIWSSASGCLER